MMRRVGIVGASITECRGRWVEKTYWDLFQTAVRDVLASAKMTIEDVDSVNFALGLRDFDPQKAQTAPKAQIRGTNLQLVLQAFDAAKHV